MIASLRAWMYGLRDAPAALTRRQVGMLSVGSLIAAATRLLAIARSPWDWDEMLFILAMRDYDVALHHPHPPGFPLFIAAAKMLRPLTGADFIALQGVAVAGAMLIFPLTFLLARELRCTFAAGVAAATLMAAFPNVWFFGGTALSDVPSVALSMAACAAVLRGVRIPHWLPWGGFVAGCAIAFRPQNAMIVAVPLVVAFVLRPMRTVAASTIAVAIAGASFAAAAIATGPERFLEAVRAHQQYITRGDSFLATTRPSLIHVADDFFVRPYRFAPLNAAITLLVLLGLVRGVMRRDAGQLAAVAIFGPFCLFAWLMLDWNSASRFSIAYMPMYAILAAGGMQWLGPRVTAGVTIAIAATSAWWMFPALHDSRTSVSPPVAAAQWLATAAHAERSVVYVQPSLVPYFEVMAPAVPRIVCARNSAPAAAVNAEEAWFAAESVQGDRVFSRERGVLWNVARRRYFDAAVSRVTQRVAFGSGWYAEEGRGAEATRWAATRAVALLPSFGTGARLSISFYTPVRGQRIELFIDGVPVASGRSDGAYFDREVRVGAKRGGAPFELLVVCDRAAPVAGDSRALAVRLEGMTWSPE